MSDLASMAWDAVRFILPPLLTFFLGRYTKNIETMNGDLGERTKDYRQLIASIRDGATKYWSEPRSSTSLEAEQELTRQLRRMIRMRVLCASVSKGFRSSRLRELEDMFDTTISDGKFGTAGRDADLERVETIRFIAEDLDFAAMEARRADLFLFPFRKK